MLAAVSCFFNPCNYHNIKQNYFEFQKHLTGVDLFTVELSFDGSFIIPDAMQIKGNETNLLWQKERLLNLLIDSLPDKYDKIAWIDADIIFQNDNWSADAEKLLDEFPVIQLYETSILLNSAGEMEAKAPSIVKLNDKKKARPGYAWAARRELFPLFDLNIVGGADTLMFDAWAGSSHNHTLKQMSNKHASAFQQWATEAYDKTKGKVGYLPDWIIHLWHGKHQNRQYVSRHSILKNNDFDPASDIKLDSNGLWSWNTDKPDMHNRIKQYFVDRKEDEQLKLSPVKEMAIVACHFNPCNFQRPVENCKRFLAEIGQPVTLVELSFDGNFEFEDSIKINGDIRNNLMWQKERLLNIGIESLPDSVDAVCWVDADLIFENPNWFEETKQLLQKHQFVQLFQQVDYLDSTGQVERTVKSYAETQRLKLNVYAAPGGAWAARLDALPNGIFDADIVGGSDAKFLAGIVKDQTYLNTFYSALKNQPLNDWQKQQQQIAHSTVGVCSGTIKHLWHGEKANRNYNRRIEILKQSNFCSDDIAIDSNGLWSWNTDKPQLHSDVAEYFSARKEDEIDKYTAFYNSGGWSYETAKEQRFFQKWFQQKFKLKSNARILELGCGMGFQSAVLADMGFDVTGLDVCQAGITAAKQRKSKASFICDSADNLCYRFPKRHFDCIYVRGMSWFHYELDRISAETNVDIRQKTKMFFEYLKPKGLFFLQIATDFSGEIKNHVLYNRLDKYIDLFAPLGNIVHVSNWAGVELHSQEQAEQVKGNIIIVTQAV